MPILNRRRSKYLCALLLLVACKPKPSVNVAAIVNNRSITYEELDKNFQSRFEPEVHVAQILVTPFPDPNVRNLKNDKAQTDEQARKKILMIDQRLKQGEDFAMLAQSYSEDSNTAPNGGDLGFVQQSALEKVQ